MLADPSSSEPVPEQLNADGVAGGRSVVAVGIQHGADGEAIAEVWLGRAPDDGMVCVYDDGFETLSAAVTLSDAGWEQKLGADVGDGPHHLRVLVTERGSPERVVFELVPSATR